MLDIKLSEKIYFFNIGAYDNHASYFHWSSKSYHRSSFFQIKLTKKAPQKDIFYTITNPDTTIVYYAHKDTIFSMGGDPSIQSHLLEAIIEYLIEEFFDMYDESLITTCYGDSCEIFEGFNLIIEQVLNNFKNLDLVKTALVPCKGCGKTQKVIIKKSLIENSDKTTTPLVFIHKGHALLIYIDKQYKVRGSQIVSVSY